MKKTPTAKAAKPAKKAPAPKAVKAKKVAAPKAAPKAVVAPKVVEAPAKVAPVKAVHVAKPTSNYFYANGKRKTSVAAVRLYTKGTGVVKINERAFENYFPVFTDQDKIISPLKITNTHKLFDITAHVHGGGIHSQAEAVRHGIAKALLAYDVSLRTTVKHAGYLTRDSRIKERKKYGLKRARRAPQFSKR